MTCAIVRTERGNNRKIFGPGKRIRFFTDKP
jgi:hypothetical protein